MRTLLPRWGFWLAGLVAITPAAQAQTKLLRYPDIHGDRVVFTHGGDLWSAPATGGTATQLTTHPGLEQFAKFSPDGKWIAFTGQYEGDEQVYVIPATGGEPRQLTFYPARGPLKPRHGSDNQVMGWTPDSKGVLFRSMREADDVLCHGALYTVALDGGMPKRLPMPESGAGCYSPDGRQMLYTPLYRDFRHWKRYQGGWAEHLFIFDLASHTQKPIAQTRRTERDPMWIGDKVYFASDRDGTLNLFSADPATGAARQLTFSKTWDVRWPSTDHEARIVYESNGDLHVFDTRNGSDQALAIQVPSDNLASRPSHLAVERNIEGFNLSPKGERALFVARGDVFTVPIEKGAVRNLTQSPGAHDKLAQWSPDGRKIAYISDATGEDELYVVDQDGSGKPEALTQDLACYLYGPEWAPDSKRIAFQDAHHNVYVVSLADHKRVTVVRDELGGTPDMAWSPDGQFLALTLRNPNQNTSLWIWSAAENHLRRVTDDLFPVSSPAWSPDGAYLYLLSRRMFYPVASTLELDFAGQKDTGIFAYPLRKDVPHPFPPESDEVGAGAPEARKEAKDVKVRIDWDGLASRAVRVPVPADNLGGLAVSADSLLYAKFPLATFGEDEAPSTFSLCAFDLKKRKESVLASDLVGYALSADLSKGLLRQMSGFKLVDLKPESKEGKPVSTRDLYVDRVPELEWKQVFDEVWRRYRDLFYVQNMHGYDWKALRDQYRPLLQHVHHRTDLTYLLTELIGELNCGHTYVEGGDYLQPERPKAGLPGALFELDAKAGRYRIAKIFHGQNEEPLYRSPLTEPGVDAHEGDYVLAIDGQDLRGADNPYRLLRNRAQTVTLTLNAKPTLEGAHRVTYVPVASETSLLYLDFVNRSRTAVDRLSGGKVGYLHIPDMEPRGLYEFIKWFYPQIRKGGLVIDERSNGGGFVADMILERLGRPYMATRFDRGTDFPETAPSTLFFGSMVCLTSETSASDGDIFPWEFREIGLGPLIGKRTWGGVVGINGSGPLMDGGIVYVPTSSTNAPTGEYVIEGEGVNPDITVENDPASVLAGHDPQLERGVAEVLKRMEANPRRIPKRPADPVKTPQR
jgi:tricorn protease